MSYGNRRIIKKDINKRRILLGGDGIMSNAFEIGDKVKIINSEGDQRLKEGEESIINETNVDDIDGAYSLIGDDACWYSRYQLELIKPVNESCKFCIDNKIGFTYDSPNFREDFEYQGVGVFLLHFHNRLIIQVSNYETSQCFEAQRRFNFCPYCGKKI